MTRKDLYYTLSLIVLGFLAVMPGINGSALLGQGDEYMHIATVRESLDAESYFLPILNGAVNYHKPPAAVLDGHDQRSRLRSQSVGGPDSGGLIGDWQRFCWFTRPCARCAHRD